MASFLYEMDRQAIIVAVFNIYDRIFVFMNTSTMIPCFAYPSTWGTVSVNHSVQDLIFKLL